MTQTRLTLSRRQFLLAASLALMATPLLAACGREPSAPASAPAAAGGGGTPSKTNANLDKAKQEGRMVMYSPWVEDQMTAMLKRFNQRYPFIDVKQYLRLQSGKLYEKLMAEVNAGVHTMDVLNISEISLAVDFQKKGLFAEYKSPETESYDAKWKSQPEGYYVTSQTQVAGIGWNPNNVKDADAPKKWDDLLDPKWGKSQIAFKDSASGLQYAQWYMIRKLKGDDYWAKMAAQKPLGLASTTQQYEKLINGEIKINGLAQHSTHVTEKKKGAPVAIAFPEEGVPNIVLVTGVYKSAPHPECARLFIDWLHSDEGQRLVVELFGDYSVRPGMPSPEFVPKFSELKPYVPTDWDDYFATNKQFVEAWNKLTGFSK